jgi:2-haloacid dehalogenase
MSRPSVVVLDVNETLSDMSPMGRRFAEVGAPEHLAKLWFATLLRDGFALTGAGGPRPFAEVGICALRTVLHGLDLDRELDAAVEHVMSGMARLSVHPDVPEGVRALHRSGRRLVTLTNGATELSERLLGEAGIRAEFERLLSVEDAPAWKPARGAYEYAARTCGVELGDMVLVAVHAWDIDGAARAGMTTAWINRTSTRYPDCFTPPTVTVTDLAELAGRLP